MQFCGVDANAECVAYLMESDLWFKPSLSTIGANGAADVGWRRNACSIHEITAQLLNENGELHTREIRVMAARSHFFICKQVYILFLSSLLEKKYEVHAGLLRANGLSTHYAVVLLLLPLSGLGSPSRYIGLCTSLALCRLEGTNRRVFLCVLRWGRSALELALVLNLGFGLLAALMVL